jgi:hypothetical protein
MSHIYTDVNLPTSTLLTSSGSVISKVSFDVLYGLTDYVPPVSNGQVNTPTKRLLSSVGSPVNQVGSRIVERIVYVDVPTDVPVYVYVDVPVEVERIVYVDVERIVYVDVPAVVTTLYLHRAWSPDNNGIVVWEDTSINLNPTATTPSSVVANLRGKKVIAVRAL